VFGVHGDCEEGNAQGFDDGSEDEGEEGLEGPDVTSEH
jgi:hypothetical protein